MNLKISPIKSFKTFSPKPHHIKNSSPLSKISPLLQKSKHSRNIGSIGHEIIIQQTNPQTKKYKQQFNKVDKKQKNHKKDSFNLNEKNKSKQINYEINIIGVKSQSPSKLNCNVQGKLTNIRQRNLSSNDVIFNSKKQVQNFIIEIQEEQQIVHIRDRKFSEQVIKPVPSFLKQNRKSNYDSKSNQKKLNSMVLSQNKSNNQQTQSNLYSTKYESSKNTINHQTKTPFSFIKQIKYRKNFQSQISSDSKINHHQNNVPSFLVKRKKSQEIDYKQIKLFYSPSKYQPTVKDQKRFSIKDFIFIKELGTGKFGKVALVKQRSTNFVCAMKIIKKQMIKDQNFADQFIRQLKLQSFIYHPNVIKMYGYFDDLSNIYVLMELGCDGTFYKYLQEKKKILQTPKIEKNEKSLKQYQTTLKQISVMMHQIGSGINFLHNQDIIHRDLKPQNIVIHENNIKICDFGWSIYKGSTMRSTFCGTPLYLCPELVIGDDYDEKVDIWSLGIILYEIFIGSNPFNINKEQDLVNIVYNDLKSFIELAKLDNQIKDLMKGCLNKNPSQRINIKQFINHTFFKKSCPEVFLSSAIQIIGRSSKKMIENQFK